MWNIDAELQKLTRKTSLSITSSFLSKHESISVWMWTFELKIMFRLKPRTWLFSPFNNSSSQSTRHSVQCEFDNVTSLPHVVHHLLDPGSLCFHQLQQQNTSHLTSLVFRHARVHADHRRNCLRELTIRISFASWISPFQ